MLLKTSRYSSIAQATSTTRDGREIQVLTLRRLPEVAGQATVVQGSDRLDVMAHRLCADGSRFWRIADANTELEANKLVVEAGRIIEVPQR